MFKILDISLGVLWSGVGAWVLLRGLPDVRARVLSGSETPSDTARLQNNKKVGMGFFVAGMLLLLAGMVML